jgi:hypothetical protein
VEQEFFDRGLDGAPRLSLSLKAVTPVVRLPVQVGDGEYEYVAILNCVDQAIGKAAQAAAPYALVKRLPSFRIADDAVGGRQHLDQKGIAQAGSQRFRTSE